MLLLHEQRLLSEITEYITIIVNKMILFCNVMVHKWFDSRNEQREPFVYETFVELKSKQIVNNVNLINIHDLKWMEIDVKM